MSPRDDNLPLLAGLQPRRRKPSAPAGDPGKMLHAMASAGLPSTVIAAMASVFLPERLSLDERRFLEGPLVVHASAWNDTRPEWIAQQVGAEWVGIVFGQTPLYIIGPAELTAVMYGASFDAPMRHYHADLYIWASLKATAVWKRRDPVEWARELGLELMPDDQVLQPRGRLYHSYSELAHDVRRRVIAQQAERERIANREARAQQTANKPRPVISAQMKLFG